MPHDVFISHAAKDKVVVDAVCATLESRRIRCWIAPRDVVPGVGFSEAIVDAIGASHVMIVLFSAHSNASEHVIREVRQAVTKGVTILPLRIEDVPLSKDLDYFLGTTHWLDAFTPPIERHFQAVADTVSLLLSRTPRRTEPESSPTPFPVSPPRFETQPTVSPTRKVALPLLATVLIRGIVIGTWLLARGQNSDRANAASTATPVGTTAAPAQAQPAKPVPKAESGLLQEQLVIDLGGGVTMQLVLIRPGSFQMGSDNGEFEGPLHKVTITKPFYLGKYEVTQEQWERVIGSNPSHFKGAKNPVETVSWDDCQRFVAKLKEKAPGQTFRLPTEAEWEYACRAGSKGDYCYGNGEVSLGDYAWFSGNAGATTHAVGEKKPNAWGVYDMHGNVHEWCADWYTLYAGAQNDPVGPSSGHYRVLRGGSWEYYPAILRSAFRISNSPGYRNDNFGVRVVVAVGTP